MRSLLRLLTICVLLCGTGIAGRCQTLPPRVSELIRSHSLQFAVPPGFAPTSVMPNDDVVYDFAVKSQTKKLEIRYRIIPIRRTNEAPSIDVNTMYHAMLIAMALNISGGQQPHTQDYPENSVREEFGADAGATTAVRCNSDFGKDYQNCLISAMHKDDVADAYVFFLFDDLQVLQAAITTDNIYHALRFR